jgi:hypothetical protein
LSHFPAYLLSVELSATDMYEEIKTPHMILDLSAVLRPEFPALQLACGGATEVGNFIHTIITLTKGFIMQLL